MKSAGEDRFIKNMIYAMGAQGVSILLSIFLALVFPKLLGVHQYSYWRLFSLYIAYASVAHLGLNDGVYLRNGGKDYEELDFPVLKSNLKLFLGTFIYAVTTFVLDNILLIGVGMMVTIGIRSIIAEWYLAVIFEKDTLRMRLWEIGLVATFVVSTWFMGPFWGFVIYSLAYLIFALTYKKQLLWLLEYGRLRG
ncbi:MAG: hypothetical protein IJ324_08815 [Lachnospiraceae bacterium]|nr:hypothetical protein [Lachnospiraceae bacterium]